MLRGETQPKEICVTILITRVPLLQLHPWLISFSPFKFISNDLYVAKLGQVWKEVSSSVNCFRQWCAENSVYVWIEVIVIHLHSLFLSPFSLWHLTLAFSVALFLRHTLAQHTFLISMWQVKRGRNKTKRPIQQAGFFCCTVEQCLPLFALLCSPACVSAHMLPLSPSPAGTIDCNEWLLAHRSVN